MFAKKMSKNQLILPMEVANKFTDIEYFDVSVEDRKIILKPVRIMSAERRLNGTRNKIEKLRITQADVLEAVKWASKKKHSKK